MEASKPRSSEVVAREIERQVIADGWPVGRNLGSATELEHRYRVSKPTLREAVRILENRSVATMKRGPGGGLVVKAPSETLATDGAALYLEYRHVSLKQLLIVRRSLELACIDLAVQHLDEEGITRLRAVVADERPDASPGTDVSTTGFHLLLAELSGNPALALFVGVLIRLMNERFERRQRRDLSVEDLRAIHQRHEGICDAIVTGDSGLARHRMLRHLEEFEASASRRAHHASVVRSA